MRRHSLVLLVLLVLLASLACTKGGGDGTSVTSETGDGDGDSGDGDGDPGDGDGDPGDGDGDPGDGDGDPGDVALACSISCGTTEGQTITLDAGGDLQATIDAAARGDTILLEAGATFTGNFVLPLKPGTGCVTIRTSTTDAQLDPNTRATPNHANLMARVVSPGNGLAALATTPQASGYRLIGLEILPESPNAEIYDLVQFGSAGPNQTTLADVAHHIVMDRCYVHGWPDANFKRGIALNSADTCIIHSTISDFHSDFQDSQAIGGTNGPGPFEILDNRLEGAAENILFGGGVSQIPDLVPSDMTIRGNHFYKPLVWKADDPSNTGYTPWVKNLFEIKNGRNVVFTGNVLENNWVGADQHGVAIVLTPRSEGGAMPWALVENVEISNNVIKHVGGGVSILGYDSNQSSQQTNGITIRGNLFEDVRQDYAFDTVRLIQFTEIIDLTIDHNTFAVDGSFDLLRSYGTPTTGFAYTNNVVAYGGGVWSDCGTDNTALACSLSNGLLEGNVIWGGGEQTLPAANGFPATLNEIGFVDYAGGPDDYHGYALASDSPYAGTARSGEDPGLNPEAIDAARGL